MLYSIWKPELNLYEYYQDGKNFLDETPTPKARAKTKLGSAMSDVSWKVPSGARKVGAGAIAKGIVVHRASSDSISTLEGALDGLLDSSAFKIYTLLAIAFGIYKYCVK